MPDDVSSHDPRTEAEAVLMACVDDDVEIVPWDEYRESILKAARAWLIAELAAVFEGHGGCLCGAVDPDYICDAHDRLAELRAKA